MNISSGFKILARGTREYRTLLKFGANICRFLAFLLVKITNRYKNQRFLAKILRIRSSERPNCSPNSTYAVIAGMGGNALNASRTALCRFIVVVFIVFLCFKMFFFANRNHLMVKPWLNRG